MNAHMIGIAGHLTRLESQTGFRMTPDEGVALMIALALFIIIFGRKLISSL